MQRVLGRMAPRSRGLVEGGLGTLALALAAAFPVQAQQAPAPAAGAGASSDVLQEIVVTAQRRETLLKDTPVSVEAFTSDRLDAQGIRGIDDLTRESPGVTFQRQGTTINGNYNDENSDIAIRGIDSNAGASTTGLYIDDTPIQTRHLQFGTLNAFPALFDVERVEVLRGPQGTLFGSGAEGGAVRFIQPEPSVSRSSAYARAEVGTTKGGDPSYEAGAAYGAPIQEGKVGYRISASYRQDGGYVSRDSYNVTSTTPLVLQDTGTVASNANWQKTTTFRGALKFQVTPDTSIAPSVYYQKLQINDTSAFWPALSDVSSGRLRAGNALPNASTDPFSLWAVKVESELGWAHLSSNTSYFNRNQSASTDYTQFINTVFNSVIESVPGADTSFTKFTDVQHNFVEEVKLQSTDPNAPLSWVAGFFFAHQYENTTENIFVNGSAINFFGQGFRNVLVQDPYSTTDRQIALFGQGELKIATGIKAILGLRVANIKTSGQGNQSGAFVGPVPIPTSGSISETPFTPKFGLSYQPDANDLFYTTIAKGYRVGGINSTLGSVCALDLAALGLSNSPGSYKSDSLWSYEVGAKNTLLDHRLQIDSSLYYINWKDIQQNVYLPHCGWQFASNLGQATSKGFDVSVHFKATSNLLLGMDVGYTDAYYSKTAYAGAAGAGSPIVTAGDVLSTTPWNGNFMAEYQIPGFGNVDPYVHIDYQVTTGQRGLTYLQDTNNPVGVVSDPSNPNVPMTRVLALRGGARWDQFDASFYVNNALNQAPILVQSRDVVGSPLYFQRTMRPRTIGLTGTYRF